MTTVSRPFRPERIEAIEPRTNPVDPDADLVHRLRDRRPDAAEALVTRFGPRAYQLALRITGDTRDAEEVTQDALWRVFDRIQTYRAESALASWVYRITANAAYEKLRRRRHTGREVSWEDSLPSFDERGRHAAPVTDWSARVDDPASQGELRTALSRAVAELPVDYRRVFLMRDVDGASNAEVAVRLGISVLAVKARLHRARLFLRGRLSRFWDTATVASGARARGSDG